MAYFFNIKFFWILLRYCFNDNYKGLRYWLDHRMEKGYKGGDAAVSKENILNHLVELGKINSENLNTFKFENILKGDSKSSKITEIILTDIEQKLKDKSDPSIIMGFKCNLPKPIIDEVYAYMCDKGFLKADYKDFEAAFNEAPTRVRNPLKWLILNKRGTQHGRGNQTALYQFLKMMLKTVSNQDLIKCNDLFIDVKGKFINNKLIRPDKYKIKEFGFETKLNEILKKADQS
jgi:hypothetical protein